VQPGVEGWIVERATDGGPFAEVGRVDAATTTYADAAPAGSHVHALRALLSAGVVGLQSSRPSEAVVVVPPPDRDGDGVADATDNCDVFANADQGDADGDAIGDACEIRFGDTAPAGAPDGRVDVADVVRGLRFAVGLDVPSLEEQRRADVAPADVTPGPPDVARPRAVAPPRVDVADVVLTLRAAVGLTVFAEAR
jgi:hypothetical protein